ncbi:MAG: alpha/beta fold hydrolase, partial [Ilumatobacteraceae bacterium]
MSATVDEHFIRHDDVELYVRLRVVDPTQPTVVLLCGLGFHTFEYEPPAIQLAARGINTVSFDYRGHGRSSGPRGRWSLDDLAYDTTSVIDHARRGGLSHVHVVGNSLGGMVAVLAGVRDPEIASVVAVNTPAHVAEFLLNGPRRVLYSVALKASKLVSIRISVNHFYRYEDLTINAALTERVRRDHTITNARRLAIPTYRELLDTWDGPAMVRDLH